MRGSLSNDRDPVTGTCRCKDNVIGDDCSRCAADSFYLALTNPGGCIQCYCSGRTSDCVPSALYRSQVRTTFTSSDIQGFALTDDRKFASHIEHLNVDLRTRALTYSDFARLQPSVYYWKLPAKYLGNKLSSYGGYFSYDTSYRPGLDSIPNNDPEVRISVSVITCATYMYMYVCVRVFVLSVCYFIELVL